MCNLDQIDSEREIFVFSVIDQNDLIDSVRVFQSSGRLDHSDPDQCRVVLLLKVTW